MDPERGKVGAPAPMAGRSATRPGQFFEGRVSTNLWENERKDGCEEFSLASSPKKKAEPPMKRVGRNNTSASLRTGRSWHTSNKGMTTSYRSHLVAICY